MQTTENNKTFVYDARQRTQPTRMQAGPKIVPDPLKISFVWKGILLGSFSNIVQGKVKVSQILRLSSWSQKFNFGSIPWVAESHGRCGCWVLICGTWHFATANNVPLLNSAQTFIAEQLKNLFYIPSLHFTFENWFFYNFMMLSVNQHLE